MLKGLGLSVVTSLLALLFDTVNGIVLHLLCLLSIDILVTVRAECLGTRIARLFEIEYLG